MLRSWSNTSHSQPACHFSLNVCGQIFIPSLFPQPLLTVRTLESHWPPTSDMLLFQFEFLVSLAPPFFKIGYNCFVCPEGIKCDKKLVVYQPHWRNQWHWNHTSTWGKQGLNGFVPKKLLKTSTTFMPHPGFTYIYKVLLLIPALKTTANLIAVTETKWVHANTHTLRLCSNYSFSVSTSHLLRRLSSAQPHNFSPILSSSHTFFFTLYCTESSYSWLQSSYHISELQYA